MAPLAFDELEERSAPPAPPKPARFASALPQPGHSSSIQGAPRDYGQRSGPPIVHKENRANILLQQLRADDGAQSESDAEHTLHLPVKQQPAQQKSLGKLAVRFSTTNHPRFIGA